MLRSNSDGTCTICDVCGRVCDYEPLDGNNVVFEDHEHLSDGCDYCSHCLELFKVEESNYDESN